MKLINRWILVGLIFVIIILGTGNVVISKLREAFEKAPRSVLSTLGTSSLSPSSSGNLQGEAGPGAVAFAAAHLTPILFYGEVVDQNGNSIPNAEVEYSGNNVPWGGAARQQMKTNAKGEFRITSSGLSLFVSVSKENYRSLLRRSDIPPEEAAGDPSSSDSFNYAKLFGPTVHRPDKAYPVRFTLYKSGVLEPLIVDNGKDLVMEKDGTSIRVQLQPENPKTVIDLQCWTYDQKLNSERHYDWNFKMTIPNGAMVERPKGVAFIAPKAGYEQKIFEYSMEKELLGNKWKYEIEKSFFVRFEGDIFARFDVTMKAAGGHYAIVGFVLNPKVGSRNLETPPPEKSIYR